MYLKEAFEMVDKKYYGNPAVIYKGKTKIAGCVFASLKSITHFYDFEIEDENIPYDLYLDGKTLVFRVK